MEIERIEKALWQNQAKTNRYSYHLWMWRKKREIIFASVIVIPVLLWVTKFLGGRTILSKFIKPISRFAMTLALAQGKNKLIAMLDKNKKI